MGFTIHMNLLSLEKVDVVVNVGKKTKLPDKKYIGFVIHNSKVARIERNPITGSLYILGLSVGSSELKLSPVSGPVFSVMIRVQESRKKTKPRPVLDQKKLFNVYFFI